MISENFKQEIDDYIIKTGEPYVKVEKVPYSEVDTIYDNYVEKLLELEEETRKKVLDVLKSSWKANSGHSKIRQWLRLCVGIANLLKLEKTDFVDKSEAVDIVVRISRWAHSSGGFYQDFIPYAKIIVNKIWGDIENLYYKK